MTRQKSTLEDSTQRKFSCQNKEMKSDSREWNSQVSRRRSGIPNIHLNSGPTCTGAVLQGDTHGFTPSDKQMTHDIAARHGFWSMSGNYTYRHHVQPSAKLYVPFQIPLKHIDIVRRTNTALDILLESRIDDN